MNFGAVRALTKVSLEFIPGEIHALLGENGAGKTTLANVLARTITPTSGGVLTDGTVGYVHQHFAIPPGLSSAEVLSLEDPTFRFLSHQKMERHFHRVEEKSGLSLGNPWSEASSLPVGTRQRLEFARAAAKRPDLLLLDEPTAVLAPPEVAAFADSVRRIARAGTVVVFITHKLPEVFALAQRLTLLRRGELVFTRSTAEVSPGDVAAQFLQESEAEEVPAPRAGAGAGKPLLEIEELTLRGTRGEVAISRLSLMVCPGEIVAVAGVDGNGQEELARAVAGLDEAVAGTVKLFNSPVARGVLRRAGASIVPADRQREGVILDFTVLENLRLAEPVPLLSERTAEERMRQFDVRAPSVRSRARSLSGGNQQKLILARELSRKPLFLLAVSPTRGLDLGATRATLTSLRAAADNGAAVLLITSDLDEARALAGRIYILYRGNLSRQFSPQTPAALLGETMAGIA